MAVYDAFEATAEQREEQMKAYFKKQGFDKFVKIRSSAEQVKKQLEAMAGVPMYYPVGFDMKGRQYMSGYPLNPQGSKETRPLFVTATEATDKAKALASVEAEGKEVFGKERWNEVKVDAAELVADYMNPRTIAACSTKGKPDIAMFALLREYAKLA